MRAFADWLGDRYYFDDKGRQKTWWLTISGVTYYFATDSGKMSKGGWQTIAGKTYYFDDDGKLAKDTTVDGYEVGGNGARVE